MGEDAYVRQPMLTYLGNKRKLLPHIRSMVELVRDRLDGGRLRVLDGFAGSGVVSRMLVRYASVLRSNDLELYAHTVARCFLETPTPEQQARVETHIEAMNAIEPGGDGGLIARLYAPRDTDTVLAGERCFYTRENALRIDAMRAYIADSVEADVQPYCLAPLLVRASIHVNTSGVFKGFYKKDGVGCFGGSAGNALARIKGAIRLDVPLWHGEDVAVLCTRQDTTELLASLPDDALDLAYLDPPYNLHPYGSNYFMLNVIASNQEPEAVSAVSGIPAAWNKSDYNYRGTAFEAMRGLLAEATRVSRFALVSYNDEGIITDAQWVELLRDYVHEKHEFPYDCFKGSRNLRNRKDKVMERMYLVSRPPHPPRPPHGGPP